MNVLDQKKEMCLSFDTPPYEPYKPYELYNPIIVT